MRPIHVNMRHVQFYMGLFQVYMRPFRRLAWNVSRSIRGLLGNYKCLCRFMFSRRHVHVQRGPVYMFVWGRFSSIRPVPVPVMPIFMQTDFIKTSKISGLISFIQENKREFWKKFPLSNAILSFWGNLLSSPGHVVQRISAQIPPVQIFNKEDF